MTATSAFDPALGRRPAWGWRVALTMLGMFLTMVPLALVALLVMPLGSAFAPGSVPAEVVRTLPSLTMPLWTVLFVWWLMAKLDRRPLREAGLVFTKATIPTFLLATAVSTAIGVGAMSLLAAGGNTGRLDHAPEPLATALISLLAAALVHASFSEELLFRGYLLQTIPTKNPWLLALISAASFGVLHLASSGGQQNWGERVLYLLVPFGFGFLAAALVLAFRNFGPAVGIHFGTYLATDIGARLGWGEGPGYWVLCGSLHIVAACLVLFWYQRRHGEVIRPIFAGVDAPSA